MANEPRRAPISPQFRTCAEGLATTMSEVIRKRDALDTAALRVAEAKGALLAAELELEVRERALQQAQELTEPQAKFYLSVMETEAETNIARLREAPLEEVSASK